MNKYKLTYDSTIIGSKELERLSFVIEALNFEEAYEYFDEYKWSGDVFIKLELIENE